MKNPRNKPDESFEKNHAWTKCFLNVCWISNPFIRATSFTSLAKGPSLTPDPFQAHPLLLFFQSWASRKEDAVWCWATWPRTSSGEWMKVSGNLPSQGWWGGRKLCLQLWQQEKDPFWEERTADRWGWFPWSRSDSNVGKKHCVLIYEHFFLHTLPSSL